ncbi:hypothetical protein RhiirC2_777495 [Rhizophagus irregularis]|uniref:Uncharacterized protein n=1 Tax=Rhizophagus irregularis TaxID=588596 RepID=A0A2N1NEE8_9GLOM|nr:hypothetical protein RhiirC2_777495 [Rhizophagus irregularis]
MGIPKEDIKLISRYRFDAGLSSYILPTDNKKNEIVGQLMNKVHGQLTLILNDEETHKPSFRCLCDGRDSGNQQTASAAVNNTYKQIFDNKTEYSGMIFMGFDDEIINHKLLSDVLFIPIFIRSDRILIVVSQIGVSSCEEFYGAGPEFMSTLITKYKDKQSIFVQSIVEDKCILDIYDGNIIQYHNEGTTPNEIWKSISILKKYDGEILFGITNSYVQQELDLLKKDNLITCTSNDWNNIDLLNLIFKKQIKFHKIASPSLDWSKLFKKWYKQNNTIVQFPDILFQIYPDDYQFQEKELVTDPSSNRDNLMELYKSEKLLLEKDFSSQPDSESKVFWKSLREALKANKEELMEKPEFFQLLPKILNIRNSKKNLK